MIGTERNIRTLRHFSIWAIGVALVISGESFGWNNGWRYMGPVGFFLPVFIVTMLYFALIHCNIELSCVDKDADGPHTFAKKAFGTGIGRLVAFATLVEFLFASPAISNTIGEYLHYLAPELFNAKLIAVWFILIFCIINLFRIQISIQFIFFLTFLAIIELCIYFFSVGPKFNYSNVVNTVYDKYDINSIIKALPFAIWLYLGIEGISLLSKNVSNKNFYFHIRNGYIMAFLTLLILVILVLFFAAGSTLWTSETWNSMVSENNGHPLPLSMEFSLSKANYLVQVFTFIGLFGLIASLQGIIMASMKQIHNLFFPNKSQIFSSIAVLIICTLSILLQTTSFLIELSVFGAVCMYFFSGLSLFQLRRRFNIGNDAEKDSSGHKEFASWKSYLFSILVILISLFCMSSLTIVHTNFFVYFVILAFFYVFIPKLKLRTN